ncbi:hypothetical protein SALBM311S_12772 [Streptomyces alboniger]
MSALSCNMGAGVTALDEIQRGTLTRFLTTPVQPGRADERRADYPGGIGGIAVLVFAAVLLGAVFGTLSNACAEVERGGVEEHQSSGHVTHLAVRHRQPPGNHPRQAPCRHLRPPTKAARGDRRQRCMRT